MTSSVQIFRVNNGMQVSSDTQIALAPSEADHKVLSQVPRIALLTPYNGGNLGDAAIQDSMIANLRVRVPGIRFVGVTLDCENFLKRHGTEAFPLLASMTPSGNLFGRGSIQGRADDFAPGNCSTSHGSGPKRIRRALRQVPGLVPLLKRVRASLDLVRREIAHSIEAYRVLRSLDLLLISGGGQLDEEYGGAWRLPFAYCKWTFLARLARVPCAMASVGAGSIKLPASRRFVSLALRMCCYRSFRESRSKAIVAGILSRAKSDLVVPDLALSLPSTELPLPVGSIRLLARGKPIVALSPISYAKPGNWPTPNLALYNHYLKEMAEVLSRLCQRGYFVVVACSSLGDDESVIPDLMSCVDDELRLSWDGQIHFPAIETWRDFAAMLGDCDYLIASRLHGTILGFVTQTPVIAISFDPKVDWVMEDLRLTDYLMHFRDFTAADVLCALDRLETNLDAVADQIGTYRKNVLSASDSARQYDLLAGIALRHHHNWI